MYAPDAGRWNGVDALGEKYTAWSPYNYVMGSPMVLVDPEGETVKVGELLNNNEGLYVLISIMMDLSEISGVSLTVNFDSKTLQESKLTSGKEVSEFGSKQAAAGYLRGLINNSSGTIDVSQNNNDESTTTRSGKLSINTNQVDEHIYSLEKSGFNPLTYGYGVTFLHESLHTNFGAKLLGHSAGLDDPRAVGTNAIEGPTGPVVDQMNKFRVGAGLATREHYGFSFTWSGSFSNSFRGQKFREGDSSPVIIPIITPSDEWKETRRKAQLDTALGKAMKTQTHK